MHRYMRAIGFSKSMNRKELDEFFQFAQKTADDQCIWERKDQSVFAQLEKEVAPGVGLSLLGEYGEDDTFSLEYSFPYFKGRNLPVYDRVCVERHADKESFAGVSENLCLGINMIYYLQNAAEYMKYIQGKEKEDANLAITLSALSVEGRILLPVEKSKRPLPMPVWTEHDHMVDLAKNGDEQAMENLALEDMDLYATLSKRVKKEDVYSIVDSYFMPYGIECDQYAVMGEIEEMETIQNRITKETLYLLNLRCNDICFDVCINEKDLIGVPEEGRRFKGIIWMQGHVSQR